MDGLYGKDPALLHALEADGETFMADVRKDQYIYLEDPRPVAPASPPGRDRKRTRPGELNGYLALHFGSVFADLGLYRI